MKRFIFLSPMLLCGCLAGCTTTLESPSKALAFSNPRVKVWKNWFGAGAEIPTDATGRCKVNYDQPTGSFSGEGEFMTSASSVIKEEAARGQVALPLAMKNSDNQTQLNLASIQAQQAVWEKGFETIGTVGGAFLARPTGSSASGPGGLLSSVIPILTGAGIKPADVIKAMTPTPVPPVTP